MPTADLPDPTPAPGASGAPPAMPILRSKRVYLRPAERDDLPTFVRWFSDAESTRYLAMRAPFSLAMEEQWFAGMLERHGKSDYLFVICLVADGRPIGTTGLHGINREDGHASWGIHIGEKGEWDKGYGTEALEAACDFAFGQLRLERVELDVYPDNARARRSYEKAGFMVEGVLRDALFADGRHSDVIRMALLRAEWEALPRRRSWEMNA